MTAHICKDGIHDIEKTGPVGVYGCGVTRIEQGWGVYPVADPSPFPIVICESNARTPGTRGLSVSGVQMVQDPDRGCFLSLYKSIGKLVGMASGHKRDKQMVVVLCGAGKQKKNRVVGEGVEGP